MCMLNKAKDAHVLIFETISMRAVHISNQLMKQIWQNMRLRLYILYVNGLKTG